MHTCDLCHRVFFSRRSYSVHYRYHQSSQDLTNPAPISAVSDCPPVVASANSTNPGDENSTNPLQVSALADRPHESDGAHFGGLLINNNHASSVQPVDSQTSTEGDSNFMSGAFDSVVGDCVAEEDYQEEDESLSSLSCPAGSGNSVNTIWHNADKSLLEKRNKYLESGFGMMVSDDLYKVNVELLNLLQRSGAPLNLFGKVKQWCRRSFLRGVDFLDDRHLCSRAQVLLELETRFDCVGSKPIHREICLPGCGDSVTMVVHDFQEQLYSLLSDPDVMKDENLLFHNDDPFASPLP
jgi:hypothetical protein